MNVSVPEIMAEQRRREMRARRLAAGPAGLAEALSDGRWVTKPHLEVINRALIRAATLPDQRIAISMPPRHGKSELDDVWTPPWYLSLFPDRKILLGSYEASFAKSWGRRARDLVIEHQARLGVSLNPDATAADEWLTKQGGGMFTAGVGGPFTGKGGHLLIVDDPVKNEEEALSQAQRERVWGWWRSTAYTRLEPGGSAVVVMTRWHEDDLVGRLIEEEKKGGEHWDIINLAALAESGDSLGRPEGEALWPERYDRTALLRIRRAVGERVWNALYQGRPSPELGGMFKRSWWKFWRTRDQLDVPGLEHRTVVIDPKKLQAYFQSWDMSLKKTTGSDPVCGGAFGVNGPNRYLVDLEWGQMDFPETCQAVRRLTKRVPQATAKLVEDAANGPAVISSLRSEISGIIAIKPQGSKPARGAAVAPLVEAGCVFLPLHHPRRDDMIEEGAAFPNGAHDDFIDMLSQGLSRTLGWSNTETPPAAPVGSDEWEEELWANDKPQGPEEGGELW